MQDIELQQLAGAALGLNEDETDLIIDEGEDFDTPLLEKFGVDFEQFSKVAMSLLPLTPILESPLTHSLEHAFVRQAKSGYIAIIQTKSK